ncbi:hypothetical protein [Pandoraea commovens]|uniref:Uncharacterized protein n=1 Tax=Pandoraea commovens TaxID=2508289 RepID=A0A5E4S477_9BURK|nr:hypothetical protein [Pandoraea commovens]VVD68849.1 hypothetical protein PCO31010_00502 [Pandoraea commovens]
MAGFLFEFLVIAIDTLCALVRTYAGFLASLDVTLDPVSVGLVSALCVGQSLIRRNALPVSAPDQIGREVRRDWCEYCEDDEDHANERLDVRKFNIHFVQLPKPQPART